ncbi:MAG: hypothetical protein JWP04_3621 [Belnapia sp.]|nr:hypothetical protein [Belnapia sp.]
MPDSEGPPMPRKLLDYQPMLEAALPADWLLIGRCRIGDGAPEASGGCLVLAHAEVGVALIDLLPSRTPNAEAQFRRLLNAADFSVRCRGYLPVVHIEVAPEGSDLYGPDHGGPDGSSPDGSSPDSPSPDLPGPDRLGQDRIGLDQLRGRIEDAFGYDSVLTIADRGRWVAVLRRTLQAGVTWEAFGVPAGRPAHRPRTRLAATMARPLAGLARAGLVGCGLLGVFGLGFASALLLPPPPIEAIHPIGGPANGAAVGASLAAVLPAPSSPASPPMVHARAAEATLPASIEAAPLHVLPPSPVLPPSYVAPTAYSSAADPIQPEAASPAETRTAALGSGPMAAPQARRPSRLPLPIDRRCSDAVFRFQQGASLSSQDMAHVRQGCASWR